MKLADQVARLSISRQVLLTVLLPLLLLALVLSSYLIGSRIQDAQRSLHEQGDTLLDFLVSASELALLTENQESFQQLTDEPIKRSEVSDILFYKTNFNLMYSGSSNSIDLERLLSINTANTASLRFNLPGLDHTWAVVRPVISDAVGVDDFTRRSAEGRHLGWVVLLLNEQELLQRQKQILAWGLFISVSALLFAALFALWISRNISLPIMELSHSLRRYQQGDYQVRITQSHQQEIGELQRGINDLIQQVQHHQQQLQSEVDEATTELQAAMTELQHSNLKLQESKDKIELAGQAKDQFMARMSHELRTPISSVLGFIQLLEKSTLSESQQEHCRIIQNASELLLRLVDDVLDFSKFQSDNPVLERIAFSPEQSIEDVLEMQAPNAAKKGLRLDFHCDTQWSLNAMGDPTRFAQVIANLVSNAIKFTDSGEIKVSLSSQVKDNQTQLIVVVEDSGIGISAEQLPSLFQPFSQADTSINRRFGGTGLGLVICKRLVELMDGQLSLSSKLGEGSHFQVSLLLDMAPPEPEEACPELNVLLFAEDPGCLKSYEQQLQLRGLRVDTIAQRQQLAATLENSECKYDRLLVSLMMDELQTLQDASFLNYLRTHFDGELILLVEYGNDSTELDINPLLTQLAPARILLPPIGRRRLRQALLTRALTDPLVADEQQPLYGISILLAEDNRFNRILISRMLQLQGAQVVTVENGQECLLEAQQNRFELILMDQHMPVLNGLDASKAIRQLSGAAGHTPILLLTADVVTDESVLQQSQLQGVLYKPVEETLLVRTILELIPSEKELPSDVKMRLQRYGISPQELKQALTEQFDALHQGLLQEDRKQLRDNAHQLAGITSMAGLTEIDEQLLIFRQALKSDKPLADIWQHYHQMKEVYQ